jgi:hypothetical protein
MPAVCSMSGEIRKRGRVIPDRNVTGTQHAVHMGTEGVSCITM